MHRGDIALIGVVDCVGVGLSVVAVAKEYSRKSSSWSSEQKSWRYKIYSMLTYSSACEPLALLHSQLTSASTFNYTQPPKMDLLTIFLPVLLLITTTSAQFFNFQNMFGGGGGHQQEPQNMASDSEWYQAQYETGTCTLSSFPSLLLTLAHLQCDSPLRQVPLPAYALLRPFPASLPLRIPECRGEGGVWRGEYGVYIKGRMEGE